MTVYAAVVAFIRFLADCRAAYASSSCFQGGLYNTPSAVCKAACTTSSCLQGGMGVFQLFEKRHIRLPAIQGSMYVFQLFERRYVHLPPVCRAACTCSSCFQSGMYVFHLCAGWYVRLRVACKVASSCFFPIVAN